MDYFEIGKIVNTQGIKGEVRVLSTSDSPTRLEELNEINVVIKNSEKQYAIEKAFNHKQFVILKLAGVNDMNTAQLLKGASIRVPASMGLPLDDDEYYIKDIYDMQVVEENGEELGLISDIIFTGANDVYIVKKQGEKDLLIPAIKQCILNIDIENKRMTVKLIEGLRD